jgi:hypothetical protein
LIVFSLQVDITTVFCLFKFNCLVTDCGLVFIEKGDDIVDGADFLLVFSNDFDVLGVGVPVGDVFKLTEVLPNGFKGSRNLDVELQLDH